MSDYVFTIDAIPLQSKEQTKLYPFFDALKEGKLVNSECPNCKEMFWPPRSICPNCLSDQLEWKELPQEGKLVAFSMQENGVPLGFKAPLFFAMVEIDGRMRMFTRLVDAKVEDVEIGAKVKLVVEKVDENRVMPVFKPVE